MKVNVLLVGGLVTMVTQEAQGGKAVQAAARKYVDLDHLQIVCVGDASQPGNDKKQTIREVLGKYGTVEVYDTNGKKQD